MLASRITTRRLACALGAFAMAASGACHIGEIPIGDDTPCQTNSDCPSPATCVSGLCAGGVGGESEGVSSGGPMQGGVGGESEGVSSSGGQMQGGVGGASEGVSSSGGFGMGGSGPGMSSSSGSFGVGGASEGVSSSGGFGTGGSSQGMGGSGPSMSSSSGGFACSSDGDCPAGETCVNGACQGMCVPATCASLGFECGAASDGCGGVLECGTCHSGKSCVDGECQ